MANHPRLQSLRARGINPYPSRSHRTLQLKNVGSLQTQISGPSCGLPVGQGQLPVVAGRLASLDDFGWVDLKDETTSVRFRYDPKEAIALHLDCGDYVEGEVHIDEGEAFPRLAKLRLLGASLRGDGRVEGASLKTLRARGVILHGIRNFFIGRGFLEVETPTLSPNPGLEPHLDPFKTTYAPHPGGEGQDVYLLTSPEYAMKGLITRGVERCFQLSRVYRNGELGPFHNPEFTMLEWYRAFASYVDIAQDLEDLILHLASSGGGKLELEWMGQVVDLTPPFERITVRDAVFRYCDFDLAEHMDGPSMVAACKALGIRLPEDTPWDEAFFRLLLDKVEPNLGMNKPTFLMDYPAPLAALAQVRGDPFPVAERFELYIAGQEIGNAFTELSDPEAQAERFEEEREQRRALGAPDFEPDPEYLKALERGLPPTGGIAVGVDRLVMVLTGAENVRKTLAVPFGEVG